MDLTPSDNSPQRTWEAVDRYLAGEATPTETEILQAGVRPLSKLKDLLEDSRSYLDDPHTQDTSSQGPSWEALRTRLESANRSTQHKVTSSPSVHRSRYLAAFGLAIAIVWGVFGLRQFSSTTSMSVQHRTVTTQAGQRATLTFANGSQALVGPSTTLGVTTTGDGVTTVMLTGQAQFDVKHQSGASFEVRTGQSVTRVLGTTFAVRQYTTDPEASIVVLEGRVSIQSLRDSIAASQPVILNAQMLGVVTDSGYVQVTPNIAVRDYLGWARGELRFVETSVQQIVIDLARVYDADIQVADSALARRKFTWTVPTQRTSLTEALDELTTALSAHVQITGRHMILVPGQRTSKRILPQRSPLSQEFRYGK